MLITGELSHTLFSSFMVRNTAHENMVRRSSPVIIEELHWYRPQTISATQKTKSATGKVNIGHRSILATNF